MVSSSSLANNGHVTSNKSYNYSIFLLSYVIPLGISLLVYCRLAKLPFNSLIKGNLPLSFLPEVLIYHLKFFLGTRQGTKRLTNAKFKSSHFLYILPIHFMIVRLK